MECSALTLLLRRLLSQQVLGGNFLWLVRKRSTEGQRRQSCQLEGKELAKGKRLGVGRYLAFRLLQGVYPRTGERQGTAMNSRPQSGWGVVQARVPQLRSFPAWVSLPFTFPLSFPFLFQVHTCEAGVALDPVPASSGGWLPTT